MLSRQNQNVQCKNEIVFFIQKLRQNLFLRLGDDRRDDFPEMSSPLFRETAITIHSISYLKYGYKIESNKLTSHGIFI